MSCMERNYCQFMMKILTSTICLWVTTNSLPSTRVNFCFSHVGDPDETGYFSLTAAWCHLHWSPSWVSNCRRNVLRFGDELLVSMNCLETRRFIGCVEFILSNVLLYAMYTFTSELTTAKHWSARYADRPWTTMFGFVRHLFAIPAKIDLLLSHE